MFTILSEFGVGYCWLVALVCSSFLAAASLVFGMGACWIHEVPLVGFLVFPSKLQQALTEVANFLARLCVFWCFSRGYQVTARVAFSVANMNVDAHIVLSCGGFIRAFPQGKRLFAMMA